MGLLKAVCLDRMLARLASALLPVRRWDLVLCDRNTTFPLWWLVTLSRRGRVPPWDVQSSSSESISWYIASLLAVGKTLFETFGLDIENPRLLALFHHDSLLIWAALLGHRLYMEWSASTLHTHARLKKKFKCFFFYNVIFKISILCSSRLHLFERLLVKLLLI